MMHHLLMYGVTSQTKHTVISCSLSWVPFACFSGAAMQLPSLGPLAFYYLNPIFYFCLLNEKMN
jgi:hypothetical protein